MTETEKHNNLKGFISNNNLNLFKKLLYDFDIISYYKNNKINIADNLLFRAFSYNRFVMLKMLIEHGANPAVKLNNTLNDNDFIFLVINYMRHGVAFNNEFCDWFLSYDGQKIMIDYNIECIHSFKKYDCLNKQIIIEYKHLFSASELNLL